jgi:aminoglycoside phosphotransferase (APT) family kinase protein
MSDNTPQISNVDNLVKWLDEKGLGAGPLETRYISGGSQNEIYELKRDGLHAAMRIPPSYAPADRDNGILREWRIIEALNDTDVPHTDAIGVCTDPAVLGRTFYLMGFVDGWSPMGLKGVWPEPFESDLQQRKGLAFELVRGIAELSKVDWQAKGLQDLGRPDGFHERQVARWSSFAEKSGARELEGDKEAREWLTSHRPIDFIPGLMHGDYQFANVMFKHGGPAQLAALIDWEMGTVGDPKLDLAWTVHAWPNDDSPQAISYVNLNGMPKRDELLAYYAEVSGRQVDDIDYYNVLAKWKLALVLEAGFARAGNDEKLQGFGPVAANLMKEAGELAASTDYKGPAA